MMSSQQSEHGYGDNPTGKMIKQLEMVAKRPEHDLLYQNIDRSTAAENGPLGSAFCPKILCSLKLFVKHDIKSDNF